MSTSSQTDTPEYAPFFGAMGAASAIIFSGKFSAFLGFYDFLREPKISSVFYKFNTFLGKTHQGYNNSALG